MKPSETKSVHFTVDSEMLEFTGLNMDKTIETGSFTFMLGALRKKDLAVILGLIRIKWKHKM
ncbi:hypothetical protein [Zobellia galactanivorans]|uniref:hypothetical protein n=1 Tax=Zobellia galactanivorans (strain DSM 12802 / CCUG 47099 / CIP 106680 / NCIMB 13871 / Dsij) TaxID=63186 RepID=UPI00338FF3A9